VEQENVVSISNPFQLTVQEIFTWEHLFGTRDGIQLTQDVENSLILFQ